MDEVFVISRIMKVKIHVHVSVKAKGWGWSPLLRKNGSCAFASSLMASNTKQANLAWLQNVPLEIMHRSHTWHDNPWPWVSLVWLLHNPGLSLRAITHSTCYSWEWRIFPWCYRWNHLWLKEFAHKVTSFLWVWRTRPPVTHLMTALWSVAKWCQLGSDFKNSLYAFDQSEKR